MVFLGIMAFFSLGLSKETIAGDVFAAGGFPLLVIVLGFLLCIILIIKQARAKKEAGEKLLDLSSPAGRAIAFSALALAAYIATMNIFGFILSTLIYSFAAARVTGYRKYRKLVIFSLLTTVALFALFGKAFFVPLPRGVGILKELSYLLY
ncbi:MAG: tripartite tricarboxylate transporter TctB family protein [Treponemataceae bacterium]